jgi:superfamily II DNA or RNA helicase
LNVRERKEGISDPPEEPEELLAWARAHHVADRLDDVLIGDGPAGTTLPGRVGERFTYREILILGRGRGRYYDDDRQLARKYLGRIAEVTAAQRDRRAWLDARGRPPEDETLAAFLEWLQAALKDLAPETAPRRPATYEADPIRVLRHPRPLLSYHEQPLLRSGLSDVDGVGLLLLGWKDGPPQWVRVRDQGLLPGEPPPQRRRAALEEMIDFLIDPESDLQALLDILKLPAWQVALGSLDDGLTHVATQAKEVRTDRIAFRVGLTHGGEAIDVEPLRQKRGKTGVYSKGSRLEWYNLADRPDLTPADRRAFAAYDDRFARGSRGLWSGSLTAAQVFGILRALVDHPAVYFEDRRDARLEIRQGRLRLCFSAGTGGNLTPFFQLLDLTLSPEETAGSLRDDRHLVHLHRPDAAPPQVLLAQVGPQAAAVVRALALAPAHFPTEAHDLLAARLEPLQEVMDIEFPSQWTRTIVPADARLVARLQLLASGAVQIELGVRPVKLGPVFPPGEGPALVLEGQGGQRHGARRDRGAERQAGHALSDRLGLTGGEEIGPWSWRVGEGDPALHLVSTLQDMGDEVIVEWADDRLTGLGSVGRGQMRLKVGDRRDWFAVEGGAEIAGEVVPLAALLAAIREGRRYVAVGAHGFARIEATLREALERAEAAVFDHRGAIEVSAVASDPLVGLVEEEAQIQATAAFSALRRRMKEGAAEAPQLAPALEEVLRPYQKAGVIWLARLAHWGAGAVLADEMGLGKTVQTLAMLAHRAALGPALVVAPTSVAPNWIAEATRFVPSLKVRLHRGAGRELGLRGLGPGDVLVTSYAIATLDAEALSAIRFATLVLDEAQAVKNATTERAKALRGLQADWRLGLTGTPLENHLGEVWSLMRVISPGLLGSWEQFRARYAIPIEKFGDDRRRKTLATLLRPFLLRRTKAEVAPELPPRTELVKVVRLSPEEEALYHQLRQSTIDELAAAKKDPERDAGQLRFTLLAALTRLRQLCCHPRLVYPDTTAGSTKAAYLLELLTDLRTEGHKVLVFSQFRSFLDLLAPRLRQHGFRALVLDGTTPAEARQERIASFQRGEADLFLISLKAGGFGLNLTAADTVIHLDPWWNPAVEDQATARAHRIGQDRPVTAVRLVARDTVEEAVLGLHAAKRALAAGLLEGAEIAASLGTDELIDLIRRGPAP